MNLKSLAKTLNAVNLTKKSPDEIQHINKVEIVYRNFGKYGLNGIIFKDIQGKFFYIKKRNSNLFYFA